MATRLVTKASQEALYENLKKSCIEGTWTLGTMLPTVRELSEQHGVTNHTVFQVIQRLTDEGFLYTVPRVGVFVGKPLRSTPEFYLYIIRPESRTHLEVGTGFEEEIARRGGTTLSIPLQQATEQLLKNSLPPISGVFYYSDKFDNHTRQLLAQLNPDKPIAEVKFAPAGVEKYKWDRVYFDNINGGRYAAQHLVQGGHRRIAYLGMHASDDYVNCEWSVERMEGWLAALQSNRLSPDGLLFLPLQAVRSEGQQKSFIRDAALRLLQESDSTAVVCANDLVARELLATCHELELPNTRWPALVSFDDTLPYERNILTSFRLPWDEVGREAARLLWERVHGQITGEPISRSVPMRMIPRLSCRADWALAESLQPVF